MRALGEELGPMPAGCEPFSHFIKCENEKMQAFPIQAGAPRYMPTRVNNFVTSFERRLGHGLEVARRHVRQQGLVARADN